MKTTKNSLVSRAFGRVTSSKKAIDILTSTGFKKAREGKKTTTMIKTIER